MNKYTPEGEKALKNALKMEKELRKIKGFSKDIKCHAEKDYVIIGLSDGNGGFMHSSIITLYPFEPRHISIFNSGHISPSTEAGASMVRHASLILDNWEKVCAIAAKHCNIKIEEENAKI